MSGACGVIAGSRSIRPQRARQCFSSPELPLPPPPPSNTCCSAFHGQLPQPDTLSPLGPARAGCVPTRPWLAPRPRLPTPSSGGGATGCCRRCCGCHTAADAGNLCERPLSTATSLTQVGPQRSDIQITQISPRGPSAGKGLCYKWSGGFKVSLAGSSKQPPTRRRHLPPAGRRSPLAALAAAISRLAGRATGGSA